MPLNGKEILKTKPNTIYIPYIGDIHTDHQITNQVMQTCVKSFRYPSVKKVLMYETLSETNFNFYENVSFKANVFVDISKHINKKVKIMEIYKSEFSKHPFPRSDDSIRSLARLRGSQSGYKAAEAFQLIIQR